MTDAEHLVGNLFWTGTIVTMSSVAQTGISADSSERRGDSASREGPGSGLQAAQIATLWDVRSQKRKENEGQGSLRLRSEVVDPDPEGLSLYLDSRPGDGNVRGTHAGGHPGFTLEGHDGHSVRAGPDWKSI